MKNSENNFLCFICLFLLLIIVTFSLIGEKEDKPQKVQIVNTPKGGTSVK